ncbi:TPA: MFS transporter [Pseudomonas aeruginosa]
MSEVNPRQGRLACIYFFAMAGLVIGNLMGRIPALKEQTQLDERALGQALLGVGVGALTAFPLSGFLVQRIGSRSVVIGGCLIMLLVFPLLGLSQGWWQLALAFYVLGVSFAGMDVAMVVGRLFGDRLRGRIDDAPLLRGLGSLATLGMLVALFSPWPALSIAGFGVVGLGLSVMVPIVISAAGNQPGIDPVIGVAAVSTVGYGGLLMGPPLIGLLAHEIGLRWALLVLVGLCLLLALRADLVRRRPRSA